MQGLRDPGFPGNGAAKDLVRFSSPIKAVLGPGTVELERSLPWEVSTEWSPGLHRFAPTVEEAGVEGMTFEFPWTL